MLPYFLHFSEVLNSDYPDVMGHITAFHQGLHCFLKQTISSDKKYNIVLKLQLDTPR